MAYYNSAETQKRLEAIRKILVEKNLDAALVYFDELNVANGWYLTGWCGQFEKGAVLVPVNGGRIETGFVITDNGCKPLSPKLFDYFMKDL